MDQNHFVIRFGKLVTQAVKLVMDHLATVIKSFEERIKVVRKKRIVFYSSKYKKTPKARMRAQLRRIQRE